MGLGIGGVVRLESGKMIVLNYETETGKSSICMKDSQNEEVTVTSDISDWELSELSDFLMAFVGTYKPDVDNMIEH